MTELICKVLRCPKEIADSTFIRIVGDQRHCVPNILQSGVLDWRLLANEWDPLKETYVGQPFAVTEEELTKWGNEL